MTKVVCCTYRCNQSQVVRLPIFRCLPFSKVGECFSALISFLEICLSVRRSEGSQTAVIIDQKKLKTPTKQRDDKSQYQLPQLLSKLVMHAFKTICHLKRRKSAKNCIVQDQMEDATLLNNCFRSPRHTPGHFLFSVRTLLAE